jgi:hypothetical protein
MLPQSPDLGVAAADTRRSARNGRRQTATIQLVRGENKPAQNAERGVTRSFVVSRTGEPLMPCSNARARILIRKGRAKICRLFPFTIQLLDRESGAIQLVAIKIDPGAKITGIVIVRCHADPIEQTVLHRVDLVHRGGVIRKRMLQRAMLRRRRRSANLRYRAPRFNHRSRCEDWLPPSLKSRVDNVATWLARYIKTCTDRFNLC